MAIARNTDFDWCKNQTRLCVLDAGEMAFRLPSRAQSRSPVRAQDDGTILASQTRFKLLKRVKNGVFLYFSRGRQLNLCGRRAASILGVIGGTQYFDRWNCWLDKVDQQYATLTRFSGERDIAILRLLMMPEMIRLWTSKIQVVVGGRSAGSREDGPEFHLHPRDCFSM